MEHTDKIRPSVVVRRTTPDGRGVSADSPARPVILVRRFRPGLGAHLLDHFASGSWSQEEKQLPINIRELRAIRLGLQEFQHLVEGLTVGVCGQHHSTSVCEETGRNDVRCSEFRGSISSPVDRVPECRSPTTVCYGISQCSCGFVKPLEPSDRFRVDIGSGSGGRTSSEVAGERGPVRNFSKLPDPSLLFADQRSDGGRNSRLSSIMGRSIGVCVSSVCSDQGSHQETAVVSECLSNADCSLVASEGAVPGPSRVGNRTTLSASLSPGPITSTSLSSAPSSTSCASASRVATVERFTREVGVSRQVAQQLVQCHRASLQRLYQHCYRQWCASRGHTVSVLSIAKIADFLLFLRKEKGLAVLSIKGFWSMLTSVFKFRLPEIQDSFIIKDLIRSFEQERPPRSPNPPSWDLVKVLSFLRDAWFEPLTTCNFHMLTMKVLFLLFLATAKRASELHALSRWVAFQGKIYLFPTYRNLLLKQNLNVILYLDFL